MNHWIGRKHTEESKRKQSQAKLLNPVRYWAGKKRPPHSAATKEKMRLSHLGKRKGIPLSIEHKIKLSKALSGKHLSEETKKKVSMNNSKYWKDKKRPNMIGNKWSLLGIGNWKGGICNQQRYSRERRVRKIGASGSHTLDSWNNLKASYNYTCPCCGKKEPEIKLTEDHIIPLIKGGSDNIENIQPLCLSCNSRKHTKIIRY